jgi:KDO2-lipid IV(A) lauroyltransferase
MTERNPMLLHVRHRLEWLAVKGILSLVQRGTPEQAQHRIRWLSHVGRRILTRESRWAVTNLKLIYGPQLTDDQYEALATLTFENIFLSYMEGIRLADRQWRNPETVTPVLETWREGRGLILCNVHLGCWEPGLHWLAQAGLPLHVVYRHANNPLTEREFIRLRQPYGIRFIRRNQPRAVLEALRNREAVGLMVDINMRRNGRTAPFLGVPAQCPVGPARLAIRFQCPIIAGVFIREGTNSAILFGPVRIDPPAQGDPEAEAALTTRINATFEPWIHQYAEQYNWLHARWRSRPDGSTWRPSDDLATLWATRVAPHPVLAERVLQQLPA